MPKYNEVLLETDEWVLPMNWQNFDLKAHLKRAFSDRTGLERFNKGRPMWSFLIAHAYDIRIVKREYIHAKFDETSIRHKTWLEKQRGGKTWGVHGEKTPEEWSQKFDDIWKNRTEYRKIYEHKLKIRADENWVNGLGKFIKD